MAEQFQFAKPLADRVLIEAEVEQTKTAGGIIIPETAESRETKIASMRWSWPWLLGSDSRRWAGCRAV